jgi:hypothetical protein
MAAWGKFPKKQSCVIDSYDPYVLCQSHKPRMIDLNLLNANIARGFVLYKIEAGVGKDIHIRTKLDNTRPLI